MLSTTTPDNCKKILYDDLLSFAFFDVCDTSCPIAIDKFFFSFLMNFLKRIFSVCHSFRSMCQSGRMQGFERCFKGLKVEDQATWHRQNLHAAILRPLAKRIHIKPYEPHLRKEKPVMGNTEPLLGII